MNTANDIILIGKVISGQKKAAFFTGLDWVMAQCQEKLGFQPFPGTLNLELDSNSAGLMKQVSETTGLKLIPPEEHFCEAEIRPVAIQGLPGAVILPPDEVRIHDETVMEILAPCSLKEELGLFNGDSLPVQLDLSDWSKTTQKLYQMAEPYLAVRGDLLHARIAHRMALILLQVEGGDRRIIEPAVVLHDVGWSSLTPEQISRAYGVRAKGEEARRLNRLHETNGAIIARRILESVNYDRGLTDRIIKIIETHDSGRETVSLEESIVKDSDKLYRYARAGFNLELKRQGVPAEELIELRVKGLKKWFFTSSAGTMASEALKDLIKSLE